MYKFKRDERMDDFLKGAFDLLKMTVALVVFAGGMIAIAVYNVDKTGSW